MFTLPISLLLLLYPAGPACYMRNALPRAESSTSNKPAGHEC